jgi:hypothetical protein
MGLPLASEGRQSLGISRTVEIGDHITGCWRSLRDWIRVVHYDG